MSEQGANFICTSEIPCRTEAIEERKIENDDRYKIAVCTVEYQDPIHICQD
jgi:hypothetical protein